MGGIAIGGIRGGTGLKHRAALADNVTERPNVTRIQVKCMHEEIVFDTRMKKESCFSVSRTNNAENAEDLNSVCDLMRFGS
jgi:hypothetical protein